MLVDFGLFGGSIAVDSYFRRKQCFKVKMSLTMDMFLTNAQFSLHTTLIDELETLVEYCDVFNQSFRLSFWRHPFTADYLLVSKQYLLVLLHFSRSVQNFSKFHFWVNYSFSHVTTTCYKLQVSVNTGFMAFIEKIVLKKSYVTPGFSKSLNLNGCLQGIFPHQIPFLNITQNIQSFSHSPFTFHLPHSRLNY